MNRKGKFEMNKVILMGRLTRDPQIQYTKSEQPVKVARYTLAVDRRFKKVDGEQTDFINCVTFNKNAEFTKNYYKKGLLVLICGRLQNRSYTDKIGQKRWITEVVVDEHNFAESKRAFEARQEVEIDDDDDILPF